RLERLILLLDTGSASGVRTTAANQLGDIMKQHPGELKNLLGRVSVHLRSSTWETRIAAGQAIGAIAKNASTWDPDVKIEEAVTKSVLTFKEFDILNVMKKGKKLLASAGIEYDLDMSNLAPNERMEHLKKNLKKNLGIGSDFIEDDFLDDIDTTVKAEIQPPRAPSPKEEIDMSALSARERNRLKRKNKKEAKDKILESRKRIQAPQKRATVDSQIKQTSSNAGDDINNGKVIVESKVSMEIVEDPREWPFEEFCETLCIDLFDPNWVVRHGAAIGLREILKYHGKDAGKIAGLSKDKNDILHEEWLEDVCIRLLCVFALDRFGDFVSDSVVAPVRETCSQTLGTLIQYLPPELVFKTQTGLLNLVAQGQDLNKTNAQDGLSITQWESRHAGLLGLKYLIAVRTDLVEPLLKVTIDAIIFCLDDGDDDVRGVSAASILPVTEQFVNLMPDKAIKVATILWLNLKDAKDDLSASTSSVMDLLARLFSYPKILQSFQDLSKENNTFALANLVPVLFPFFRHTISSVRLAVLDTLQLFLDADQDCRWVDDRVFKLVFQNILFEEKEKTLDRSEVLWKMIMEKIKLNPTSFYPIIRDCVPKWFLILMTPLGTQIDLSLIFLPKPGSNLGDKQGPGSTHNVDSGMLSQDFALISKDKVLLNRLRGAKALGTLMKVLPTDEIALLFDGSLGFYIQSAWGMHQHLSAAIIEEWFIENQTIVNGSPIKESLSKMLVDQLELSNKITLIECIPHLRQLRSELLALLNTATMEGGVDPTIIPALPSYVEGEAQNNFTIDVCRYFVTQIYDQIILSANKNSISNLEDRKKRVLIAMGAYEDFVFGIKTQVTSAISCAVTTLEILPPKLSPIITSMMNSIKKEPNQELQIRSSIGLSRLIYLLSIINPKINPTNKIVRNLCTFICSDTSVTPRVRDNLTKEEIYSLSVVQGPIVRGRGRPCINIGQSDPNNSLDSKFVRRGSELCLEQFCKSFGPKLFEKVPKLWELMFSRLQGLMESDKDVFYDTLERDLDLAEDIVDGLHILSTVVHYLDASLLEEIRPTIPWVLRCLQSPYSVIRHMAAKCFSVLCDVLLSPCMQALVSTGLPLLMDHSNVINRQGFAEAIYFTVQTLETKILPYVIFLVVPILGRMSDNDDHVRLVASNCFALLINLIPLESGMPDPEDFPIELIEQRSSERKFINQLLDAKQLESFDIPIKINAELRSYQQEGVNWLAFLNRYQLHGILCDDMGLGKTLQSICMLASDQYTRAALFKKTNNPDQKHLPSLVICPTTLIPHWYHEINTYTTNLRPLCYSGVLFERRRIAHLIPQRDVVIMSYEIIRNDIEELSKYHWNYCILDEGHIIKNGKTKITKAIKQIKANHRLILSGTPIQNNVLELWSLFDFLMPGFLGTEKSFNEMYSKPILASREAKSSSKEQEAGALALEALHKQVLPFLLRRLKEDVLDDLPPKIIQDYYCDLGEVQKQLYDDFSKSQNQGSVSVIDDDQNEGNQPEKKTHIFQALQYIRKLCNHPLLALTPKHPQYNNIMSKVGDISHLHDLVHAPKLLALKQLLNDCGIGLQGENTEEQIVSGAVSQHRALIFFQHKVMLELVEKDLLHRHLPNVTYLKIDGGIEASKRHNIVVEFNQDPSIDLLLLTTHVGGLGLNLTGADTVIFVEHDWNPMKDMQAMDRAHRIGQKKVVNVYRLITRDTLEEKIMGLQRFKLNIANSVVNQQNSGLGSMNTNQLFDLFSAPTTNPLEIKDEPNQESTNTGVPGAKVLEGLEKLWDEKQYEEEFDLDNFISGLKPKQ
ncbi:hypothetical protein K502DRAFT_293841, partial [Neoconidiobolus thromboides FSU 785]